MTTSGPRPRGSSSRGWMPAAVAALAAMAVTGIIIFAPLRLGALLFIGAVVFVIVIRTSSEFWFRMMAMSCFGSALTIGVVPNIDLYAQWRDDAFGRFVMDSNLLLAFAFVIAGLAFAYFEHRRTQPNPRGKDAPMRQKIDQSQRIEIASNHGQPVQVGNIYANNFTFGAPTPSTPPAPAPPEQDRTDNLLESNVFENSDFVGREEELRALHQALLTGNAALVHALAGEGGLGKTEIARAYVLRHAADWDGRWWLDASEEGLETRTAELFRAVFGEPPPDGADTAYIRNAIRRRLCDRKSLLVLDNVESDDRMEEWRLQGCARVLATTRRRDIPPNVAASVEVGLLPMEQAVELLAKHRPDLQSEEHGTALREVAEHLGRHTLALAMAGTWLRRHPGRSPVELHAALRDAGFGESGDVFESVDPSALGTQYKHNVRACLLLHLPDFVDTPAFAILGLAAFCDPNDIPIDLLTNTFTRPESEMRELLARLNDMSILRCAESVGIHRLMQSAIRSLMDEESKRSVLTALIQAIASHYKNPDDHRAFADMDRYAPHALSAVEHAESVENAKGAGYLANQCGNYLFFCARFDEALHVLRSAERIDRAAYGDDHPNVATCVNNIGNVLHTKGDLDGALDRFQEAEQIDRAAYGDGHRNVANRVNNIGTVLHTKGDLDGALDRYQEAERIVRAAHGDDHPDVATCVNNIGDLLRTRGDLDGALARFQEAERIDRTAYGDEHPMVAVRVNNIGGVLRAKGDKEGAQRCYEASLCILLRAYGARGQNVVAAAFNVLGVGGDPVAIARDVGGGALAEALKEAMKQDDGGSEDS